MKAWKPRLVGVVVAGALPAAVMLAGTAPVAQGRTTGVTVSSAGVIVYSRACDLYEVNADGTGTKLLTPGTPSCEFAPSLSPDGTQLVFGSTLKSASDIYVMALAKPASADWTRLTSSGGASDPEWSSDGSKLAFVQPTGANKPQDVYTYDLASKKLVDVTNTKDDPEYTPAWSPDGKQIAYASNVLGYGCDGGDTQLGFDQIYVVSASGGVGREVIGSQDTSFFAPAWHGSTLAVAATRWPNVTKPSDRCPAEEATTIDTLPAAGGSPTVRFPGRYPGWAPDGSGLVFSTEAGVVTRANVDGTDQHALGSGYFAEWAPAAKPASADLRATFTTKQLPASAVAATASTATTTNGRQSTYTIAVSNSGPNAAQKVVVTGTIGKGVDIVTPAHIGRSWCSLGATFTCKLGTVPAKTTKTITMSTLAIGNTTRAANVVSNVKVTSATGDPHTSTNHPSLAVRVAPISPSKSTKSKARASVGSAAAANAFPDPTWSSKCYNGAGRLGGGAITGTVTVREIGKSGTTHFTVNFRGQRYDPGTKTWSTLLQGGGPSTSFPNNNASYHWSNTWEYSISPADDGSKQRLQVQVKWIHDYPTPLPDRILHHYPSGGHAGVYPWQTIRGCLASATP